MKNFITFLFIFLEARVLALLFLTRIHTNGNPTAMELAKDMSLLEVVITVSHT